MIDTLVHVAFAVFVCLPLAIYFAGCILRGD